mmetsp:Transcript_3217/g.9763  ORF Transcript_3217/g.9763 Transcript_3217/m.9763 type:complete len:250 (-) Transcript_3217:121-870(-)
MAAGSWAMHSARKASDDSLTSTSSDSAQLAASAGAFARHTPLTWGTVLPNLCKVSLATYSSSLNPFRSRTADLWASSRVAVASLSARTTMSSPAACKNCRNAVLLCRTVAAMTLRAFARTLTSSPLSTTTSAMASIPPRLKKSVWASGLWLMQVEAAVRAPARSRLRSLPPSPPLPLSRTIFNSSAMPSIFTKVFARSICATRSSTSSMMSHWRSRVTPCTSPSWLCAKISMSCFRRSPSSSKADSMAW